MTKTISLADDAYDALAAAKRAGESFSDVARRLARLEARTALLDPNVKVAMTDDEADRWKGDVYEERGRSMKPRYDAS